MMLVTKVREKKPNNQVPELGNADIKAKKAHTTKLNITLLAKNKR